MSVLLGREHCHIMNIIPEILSIVITAKDFNVSIFKPFWLMKNSIFREEELQGNIIITPPAVQIPTENFQFMILPDRIQMSMPRQYTDAEADIGRILGGIVKTLPHTPYKGLGINFNYFVSPEAEETFSSWNRNLLASTLSNKIQSPKDKNARFGSYVSFDVIGTRLKIDIKPVKASKNIVKIYKSWHAGQDLLRVNLNFHSDVINADSPSDFILDKLGKWTEALALSKEITGIIAE